MQRDARVAIIGFGKMGILHGALLSAANIGIVAIVDSNKFLGRAVRKRLGPKGIQFSDNIGLVEKTEANVAYVLTPVPAHFSAAKHVLGLENVKGLFVEKTLTDSYEKSRELCELAAARGIETAVGYHRRFSVTYNFALNVLRGGTLGKLLGFNGYSYSADVLGIEEHKLWRATMLGGKVLRELGSHLIDIITWYFGSDLNIGEVVYNSDRGPELGTITINAEFDGIDGVLKISRSREGYRIPEVGLIIQGEEGTLIVTDTEVRTIRGGSEECKYRPDLGDDVRFLLAGPEYYREDENFISSVFDRTESKGANFRAACEVDRVVELITAKLGA